MELSTPQLSHADPKTLARLAETTAEAPVLSLFMELGPAFATPQARQSELNSLMTLAQREIEQDGAKKELSEALPALKDHLQNDEDWWKDARGAAVYFSPDGIFEVVRCLEPLETKAEVSAWPHIEPLSEVVTGDLWCVMMISRPVARYLMGFPRRLREVESIEDDVRGQHSQGGWSQARFERSVEQDVHDHIKKATEELRELLGKTRFDRLVVVTLPEMWPDVEKELHSDLKDRLAGVLELDIEHSSVDEVRSEVEQLAEVRDNEKERELLDALQEGLGRGERAAGGVTPVFAALAENRVATFLVDESFERDGVACTSCGWAGLQGKECPVDSKPLRQGVDLKDWGMRRTLATSGEVRVVKFHPDLQSQEGIGAILRY